MRRSTYIYAALVACCLTIVFNDAYAQEQAFSYAYIAISDKALSNKLNVEVDLGDTPEQIKMGLGYSEFLSRKTSHAAVLNFMTKKGFELVKIFGSAENNNDMRGFGMTIIMRKEE